MLITELDLALDVGKHLDAVGARWCIGGSVASSLLGVPRATLDVDLVADLRYAQVKPLCAALISQYYVDAARVHDPAAGILNAIHLETMIKIDVFCAKDDELSRNELCRRLLLNVGGHSVPVCTPEDIILQKLIWYVEAGGSERQWGDALGVVRTRRAQLDLEYLTAHAAANGLNELLARLLATP